MNELNGRITERGAALKTRRVANPKEVSQLLFADDTAKKLNRLVSELRNV